MSTTLDTLQVAKDLQAASFSEQQAEALARLLRERQQADSSQLVTRASGRAPDAARTEPADQIGRDAGGGGRRHRRAGDAARMTRKRQVDESESAGC